MLPAARWIVVAVVAIACATAPALLRVVPAHDSDISATALAKRIHASAALGWSGEVHALGALEVPLTGSTFGGVSRLLGGQTDLRVWWRDPEHWRARPAPHQRRAGPRSGSGTQTMRWTYESSTARFTPYSEVRLPNDSDVVPPVLADRLLSGAKAAELTRLPARRVDGRSAAGLRLVPSDPRTTIARVDVWADEDSGLPLRVDVYDEGGRDRPILTTQARLAGHGPTRQPSVTSFQTAVACASPAERRSTRRPGPTPSRPSSFPTRWPTCRDAVRPETFGAVGIYGRGPTALVGIPLRSFVTGLYDQLSSNRNATVTGQRVSLQVGPLSVLLLVGRDVGLLLTGTVTPATLETATPATWCAGWCATR